ncbi:MAG: DNA repair protein RadC [Hungatella sp.]|nr:DNA repair protein RadC [Hungatella sp.]
MDHIKIKDIPENDRPYEKCLRMGPEGLSDAELLAVIIRTGSRKSSSLALARQVLELNYPNDDGLLGLCRLTLPELKKLEGIGTVKGIQLLCIGELSKRISRRSAMARSTVFDNPRSVVEYYMEEVRHLQQEHLYVMLLNVKNQLIRDLLISKGTVNASLASPREIFIQALRYQAVGIILVHNHPSGDPVPSREDCMLTRRVFEAGNLIEIQLLDHIVIGDNSFCSFKKEGML